MGFRSKILLTLIAVGVTPVLVLGWFSSRTNEAELIAATGRLQLRHCEELARYSDGFIARALGNLRATASYSGVLGSSICRIHDEQVVAVLHSATQRSIERYGGLVGMVGEQEDVGSLRRRFSEHGLHQLRADALASMVAGNLDFINEEMLPVHPKPSQPVRPDEANDLGLGFRDEEQIRLIG